MTLPVRPIFQNGQRLTADRLTQAVEFLRTFIRRLALAPLGTGVAAGLDLGTDELGRAVISPGIAIDGRGRLLIVEAPLFFTVGDIESQAGTISPGNAVQVRLIAADQGTSSSEPCSQTPGTVVEGVSVQFSATSIPGRLDSPYNASPTPYCVDPWGDLDAGSAGCGVVLGDLVRLSGGSWSESLRSRQGVSAEFGAIRSPTSAVAMTLGQMNLDLGDGTFVHEAVAFAVAAEFENRVRFRGDVRVGLLTGDSVQSTHMAPLGQSYPTASYYALDPHVFVVSAGAGTDAVPNGQGGLSAVLVELDWTSTNVDAPGQPLYQVIPSASNPRVRVRRGNGQSPQVIGLSAAPAQIVGFERRVVPLASAGLVKVYVNSPSVTTGNYLTPSSTPGQLTLCGTGQTAVARAAESRTSPGELYAWVIYPALDIFPSSG